MRRKNSIWKLRSDAIAKPAPKAMSLRFQALHMGNAIVVAANGRHVTLRALYNNRTFFGNKTFLQRRPRSQI